MKIFYHFLHMHENGQRMRTRQYRNDINGNEVLVNAAEVEYYSFLQAGGFPLAANGTGTIQVRGAMGGFSASVDGTWGPSSFGVGASLRKSFAGTSTFKKGALIDYPPISRSVCAPCLPTTRQVVGLVLPVYHDATYFFRVKRPCPISKKRNVLPRILMKGSVVAG